MRSPAIGTWVYYNNLVHSTNVTKAIRVVDRTYFAATAVEYEKHLAVSLCIFACFWNVDVSGGVGTLTEELSLIKRMVRA